MYRINKLIATGRRIFYTDDLQLIWDVKRSNTLYTTLKRYVQKGILYRIKKGIYSYINPDKLDILEVANFLIKKYCYLSTETILRREGIIFQQSNQLTFVSNYSAKLVYKNYLIRVRKLADKYLYNNLGIIKKETHNEASLDRAVADILYFNPRFYFDNPKFKMKKVKSLQKQIGYL